jgi:hypothetical protein
VACDAHGEAECGGRLFSEECAGGWFQEVTVQVEDVGEEQGWIGWQPNPTGAVSVMEGKLMMHGPRDRHGIFLRG